MRRLMAVVAALVAGVALGETKSETCTILVSREANRIETWSAPAKGPGEWTLTGVFLDGRKAGVENTGIAASEAGVVYVGDAKDGGRIRMYGTDGAARGVLAKTGCRPDQLCLSPDGRWLYVSSLEKEKGGVLRFDTRTGAGGRYVTDAKGPRTVKFGADGYLYVGCRTDNAIRVYDVSGNRPKPVGKIVLFSCSGAFEMTWPNGTTLIVPGARTEVLDLLRGESSLIGKTGVFKNAIGACMVSEEVFAGDFPSGVIWHVKWNGDGARPVARGVGGVCSLVNLTEATNGEAARVRACYAAGLRGKKLAYRTPKNANDFARMSFNNPEAIIDLKAGFSADWIRVTDVDGDGQLDLVVKCGWGDWPWAACYLYRNPTPKGKTDTDPVFPKAERIDESTLPPALPDCRFADGREINDIHYTAGKTGDFWVGRATQQGDRQLKDLDGDGVPDLVIRTGDRKMDAWQDCYDARGNWKEIQLRSFVYWLKGLGGNRFGEPAMLMLENGLPVEVYGGHSSLIEDYDGDGDLDLILFDFMDTITYFENVGSRTAPLYTSGRFLRTPEGARLHGDLCLPHAVSADWDRDGRPDLVFAEEDSRVAWCRNTGKLSNGMPVFEQPRYFRQRADELHFGALSCPWAYDWDGDGDQDLIVGNSHGQVAFIENLSGPKVEQPKWAPPKLLTEPDGKPIWPMAGPNGSIQGPCESKWGYATVSVADWDGDGLPDLMLNNTMGQVMWWRNVGTRTQPKLDFMRRVEVEWEGEQPELAWGWMKPKNQANPKALLTQWRTTPVMFDWTGDGLMDLMMLDHEGYLALFAQAKAPDGKLIVRAPRRVFLGEDGKPLRLQCGFNRGIGCGRRKFAVCDWDGDGKTDIVCNGGPNAEVYLQVAAKDGSWTFRSIGPVDRYQLSTHDPQPSACDFNGDGIPDLVFGAMDGYLYYLRNPRSQSSLTSTLLVSDAATVGVDEARDILTQIDAGRPALVIGGPFMSDRKVRLGEEMLTLGAMEARVANLPMAYEAFGPKAGWRPESWTHSPGPSTVKGGRLEPTAEGGCRFVSGGPLAQWDIHYLDVSPYGAGDDLLLMELRSAYPDAQMSVELVDRENVRWFATVEIGTAWKKVALTASDFVRHGPPSAPMNPATIRRLGIGISEQYTTRMAKHPSSFEIRHLGSAKNPLPPGTLDLPNDFPKTTVEGLWPTYKVWEKNGALAYYDRHDGAGYGRGNVWRQKRLGNEHEMILLERRAGRPERCVAFFGYKTRERLESAEVQAHLAKTRELLEKGALLFEGGSDQFAYFPGETARIGASWRGTARKIAFEIRTRGGASVLTREFADEALKNGKVEFAWPIPAAHEGTVWQVSVTLDDGADRIAHDFALAKTHADQPEDFITVHDGDFWLKDRKWYPACINFWPLYSCAAERADDWRVWQRDGYYAPNLVRKDLESFKRLGGNAISIQYNGKGCGRNVRDLYRICRELGIHVSQALESASPFDRSSAQQAELKAYFAETGAAGEATVFAYDTVWEPGNHVFRNRDRWNADWHAWTVEQFGSVDHAVKSWGYDPGRDAQGHLKSPPQDAFTGSAEPEKWRKVMASYRRFMDNLTSRKWAVLHRELAALAPHQLQSFRQGNTLPHDFALTGPMRHIDFVMPEGYSFSDTDADETAIGWITRYIDAYSGRKPILWSEFGRSAWDRRRQATDETILAACAGYTERFYRAGLAAGANGFSPWWFPGGYRVDERSDYGYMGPDGMPRAPLKKFAEWVPAMLRERTKPCDPPRRVFDRDANPGGYYAAAFVTRLPAEAMAIAGAELTSATAPAVALGDIPLAGEMPLKFLDSDFDAFAATPSGYGKLTVHAQLGNPGPATWKAGDAGTGGVSLVAFDAVSGKTFAAVPLARDVPRLGTTDALTLSVPAAGAAKVAFRLEAKDRFRFGEKKVWTSSVRER